MTVAEIKEYIDENTKGIYEQIVDSVFDTPSFRRMHETLEKVKLMLDDLEQPIEIDTKKYFETMDKIITKEIKRSKS